MTAAGATGAARDMRNQEPWSLAQPSPSRQRLPRFSFRSKKEGVIQGKLRIKSPSGAFLILGVFVVLVGTAVAVAGYWPYRAHRAAMLSQSRTGLNDSRVAGRSMGVRSILSTQNLIHNDRMKLLGPIIMGVGLFIFICANTMLYENRDRETQVLLAQTQKMICSMSAHLEERGCVLPRHYQWMTNLSHADLNIRCLEELTGSESLLLQMKSGEGHKWADCYAPNTLQTKALHHKESSPSLSLHSVHSDSCNSSEGNFNVLSCQAPDPRVACSTNALSLPLIKLNNCLIEAGPSLSTGRDCVRDAPPRRSYSLSCRTVPRGDVTAARTALHLDSSPTEEGHPDRTHRNTFLPEPGRKEFSSDVCLQLSGHSRSLDLGRGGEQCGAPMEERKNRSWPRLDLSSLKKYMKLENKEDSVDKLLDQLEQQYSQWERSCSGPFQ
ncbi:transmembrane protein 200A [Amia ocellicauda]|uniref:transmembrane protein 200A n=1 Tax=Amia ocellicauda TaxID=2972642 RepID=UPI003463E1D0|nr:T200A protein [Amia calva]